MRTAPASLARKPWIYRDKHAVNTSEVDWAYIDEQLRTAYGLLKKALSSAAR